MKKTLIAFAIPLFITGLCYGQDFRWPRKKAAEAGMGSSSSGLLIYGAYVYFFQPRQAHEKPPEKNFTSTVARNRYAACPCRKKYRAKIPPGLSAKLSAFFEVGTGKGISYRTVGVDGSFLYIVYSRAAMYVQVKGGLTLLNDALLTPIQEGGKQDHYNRLKYGALGGGEFDFMLGREKIYSLVLGWDQRYLFEEGDSWGNQRWYAYTGLRFKVGQ